MSLSEEIKKYKEGFVEKVPKEVREKMLKATENLKQSDLFKHAPKVGEKLKSFKLHNQNKQSISLDDALQKGPTVITFYRGGWCPYCNLELRSYQQILSDIQAAGGSLIAISPELPDASLSTIEKNEMAFDVLTDLNSEYAKEIGIVFNLDDELRPIYQQFGIEIEKHNGDNQFDLPLAATFVIDQDATIVSAFIDEDYTNRQEPTEVLEALRSINKDR